jgi:hypothetical protein
LWASAIVGGNFAAEKNTLWLGSTVNSAIKLALAKLDLHPVKRLLVALGAEE